MLTDILADPRARVAAFGERSALDLPFDVAAKTGTSKGSRDNWTVGFTREVTVAVWVGNFDGSPMRGDERHHRGGAALPRRDGGRDARTGAASAAPGERTDRDATLVPVEVCPLSGGRPTDACPHAVREWMTRAARDALAPCAMHELVRIDRRNGLRAARRARRGLVARAQPSSATTSRRAPGPPAAGRTAAPARFSPLCPGAPRPGRVADPAHRVARRRRASSSWIPTARGRSSSSSVRVDVPRGVDRVDLVVDGRRVARGSGLPSSRAGRSRRAITSWWRAARAAPRAPRVVARGVKTGPPAGAAGYGTCAIARRRRLGARVGGGPPKVRRPASHACGRTHRPRRCAPIRRRRARGPGLGTRGLRAVRSCKRWWSPSASHRERTPECTFR